MLDFILAEGYVRVPIQPRGDLYTSGKLDTHSVTILYIGSECLADLADLAGQDQLVVVIHEIEIGSNPETVVTKTITGLVII